MEPNKLPFGTQFSPNIINLKDLLQMASDYTGHPISDLVQEIAKKYWPTSAESKKMAGNCKIALTNYELVTEDTIQLTEFGQKLLAIEEDDELYKEFAKHILLHLNGLVLIETLRRMALNGDPLKNESINKALIAQGFQLKQTSNNAQVMKLWLEKAGILHEWTINEDALDDLLNMRSNEIALFKELSKEQYFFLLALHNAAPADKISAIAVRQLATASYGIDYDEKSFANRVINPLQAKDLIVAEKTTGGRGAKPHMVCLSEKGKREVVEPLLQQFRDQVGNALADAYCKTFTELHSEIHSSDTYKKGLALEAFAIKVMKIIGLDFLKTRYRDIQVGGAEVDVLFDSTRLLYTRWQVQCKNTATVTIDQVAKEVGLSHMLKSNAIVMMTTGHLTADAKTYAHRIMEDLNLCILMLEKEDIEEIITEPTRIVDIFNRQARFAKKIKPLHEDSN